MRISNKTYDVLKYIALIVLPALATLMLTLTGIWGIPYGEAIAGTITAVDVFLGAILNISSKEYELNEKNAALDSTIALMQETTAKIKETNNKINEKIDADESGASDGLKEL